MDMCFGLGVLAAVLGFIAVVGHGTWVVAAAVLKVVFESPTTARRPCPGCGAVLRTTDDFCDACGLDLASRLAANLKQIRTARREVRGLADRGELDPAVAEQVAEQLDRRADALRGHRQPRPAPVLAELVSPTPRPVFIQPVALVPPLADAPPPREAPPAPAEPAIIPVEVPPPPLEAAPPPSPPRRAGVLTAFMEERNILWGELVGGLLIVGCSIALVLTLWKQLETLPYFPFLLATAVTLALFGAGQYTLHHWKLEATSRGLLVIATLLVPLNLLLLAVPGVESAGGWLGPAVKVGAVALFVWVVRAAGRDLIGVHLLPGPIDRRWLLALAVVGPPALETLVPWAAGEPGFLPVWLPLACYVVACGAVLGGLSWYRPRQERDALLGPQAWAVLAFAGMSLFALAAAWGLVLTRAPDPAAALLPFALPLAVAGVPVAESGLLVQRRVVNDAGLTATGTGVAVAGSFLIAAGVVLAWPDPPRLTLTAALVGVVLTRVAWRDRLPWFQAGAVPALGFAVVLAALGVLGQWPAPEDADRGFRLAHRLTTPTSGVVLVGFGLFLAVVAEGVARLGNRPQAVAYALGGLAAGVVGLLPVNGHGWEEPWPAFGAYAACAVGLLAANGRWRQRAVAQAGVWLALVASLWLLSATAPHKNGEAWRGVWGFAVAVEAVVLAALALGLTRRAAGPAGGVFRQLREACQTVAVAAVVLAVLLAVRTDDFPRGTLYTGTLLTVAAAGFLLARVFAHPWPAWAGSVAGLFGLAHLTVYAAEIRPVAAALLIALLGHATLALGTAFLLRGRRVRTRLFVAPLRQSALLVSGLAVPFLLFPAAGFAPAWAGFAVWLAAVWFVQAWVWEETGAFSAGHAVLAAAAVLGGLAWAERQEWWAGIGPQGADPRLLQAIGVGLALLGLGWVAARRAVAGSERLRALWLCDPLSVDRLVVGAVVVGQLVLLASVVVPGVVAELTPVGWVRRSPAAPPHAFGPGTWLVLGLLAVVLVAALRLRTDDEPDGDAPLLGLAVLLVSAAVAWAGSFGPAVATASALRWGLAGVFLVGSAVLWGRVPLARLAGAAGFRPRAGVFALVGSYALFAAAAAVVLLVTLDLTGTGLSGRRPSGPAAGSAFAEIGDTVSFLVPLVLLTVGLAGTALRERSGEYAFAGGWVFVGTVTSGYALLVVTGGGSIDGVERIRLVMLAVGAVAWWALAWFVAERRVPGGQLLAFQATIGLVGTGLIALFPMMVLLTWPAQPLPGEFAEFGRFGWLVLGLAAWAAFRTAGRQAPWWRSHVVGFTAFLAGVLAACAVQPWDEPGKAVSFYTLTAVWAAAGLGLTAALFAAPTLFRGEWVAILAGGVAVTALVGPTPPAGRWPVPLALAGYALASAGIAARWGKRVTEPDHWNAVLLAQTIIGGATAVFGLVAAITDDRLAERLSGPLAVVALVAAAAMLVRVVPAERAGRLRVVAVVGTAVAAALVGWAVPDRGEPVLWLQRNGWAFVALVTTAVTFLEAVPRQRPGSAWAAAARRVGGGVGVAALVLLGVVFAFQVAAYDPVTRKTTLPLPEVLAVHAGIAVLIALALRFALVPAADPLGLPDRRRERYVYLAEVLLVLFFVHTRLNLPQLFVGQVVRYWTFVVMLLAFVGIGLAELFARRGVRVLARPLHRTGVFLPLIPLLAFWAKPPAFLLAYADDRAPGLRPFLGYLEKLPQHFDSYAGLWFLAGLLYGLVALSRRSFGWALLGALATNAGVWSLLAHTGVSVADHPQVWVIPLALVVLVSEHVNRRELPRDVGAGLRYLGIGMLYVSSAADMFVAGIGNSVWLPVVLAVLCVAGILGGVVLRVRAFLFLGAGFLLLDVFSMIWHAAVNRAQTWVWYASGIVLGAAILALFAVFEKRRNDVQEVMDRLRRWD